MGLQGTSQIAAQVRVLGGHAFDLAVVDLDRRTKEFYWTERFPDPRFAFTYFAADGSVLFAGSGGAERFPLGNPAGPLAIVTYDAVLGQFPATGDLLTWSGTSFSVLNPLTRASTSVTPPISGSGTDAVVREDRDGLLLIQHTLARVWSISPTGGSELLFADPGAYVVDAARDPVGATVFAGVVTGYRTATEAYSLIVTDPGGSMKVIPLPDHICPLPNFPPSILPDVVDHLTILGDGSFVDVDAGTYVTSSLPEQPCYWFLPYSPGNTLLYSSGDYSRDQAWAAGPLLYDGLQMVALSDVLTPSQGPATQFPRIITSSIGQFVGNVASDGHTFVGLDTRAGPDHMAGIKADLKTGQIQELSF